MVKEGKINNYDELSGKYLSWGSKEIGFVTNSDRRTWYYHHSTTDVANKT